MAKKPFSYRQMERDAQMQVPKKVFDSFGRYRLVYPEVKKPPSPGLNKVRQGITPDQDEMIRRHEAEIALFNKQRGLL